MMTKEELGAARNYLGMTRKQFGRAIGFTGRANNIYRQVERMENGAADIGPNVEAKVRLLLRPVEGRAQ